MARNFAEYMKKAAENKVTISESEFHEVSAEVMRNGNVNELIESNPIVLLIITAFTAELSKAIFNKNDDESEVTE